MFQVLCSCSQLDKPAVWCSFRRADYRMSCDLTFSKPLNQPSPLLPAPASGSGRGSFSLWSLPSLSAPPGSFFSRPLLVSSRFDLPLLPHALATVHKSSPVSSHEHPSSLRPKRPTCSRLRPTASSIKNEHSSGCLRTSNPFDLMLSIQRKKGRVEVNIN